MHVTIYAAEPPEVLGLLCRLFHEKVHKNFRAELRYVS